MTPEDILSIVRSVGEMLSPTAQQAWEIASKQVQVEMVSNTIWAGLLIGAAIGFVFLFFKGRDQYRNDVGGDDGFTGGILMILAGTGFLLFAVLGVACLQGAVERAINPDWYAIKLLLGK